MIYADVFGDMRSRAGIWSERPRGKAGRRGVVGLASSAESSLDFLFSGSRNFGDGDNVGGPPSDRLRAFEGDRDAGRRRGIPPSSSIISSPSLTCISGCRLSLN